MAFPIAQVLSNQAPRLVIGAVISHRRNGFSIHQSQLARFVLQLGTFAFPGVRGSCTHMAEMNSRNFTKLCFA